MKCPSRCLSPSYARPLICYDAFVIDNQTLATVGDTAAAAPGLMLLVVFGSRARGDGHDQSDWDLGYIGSATFDPDSWLAALVKAVGTDRVDLVDLTRAGALLRFRAASEGQSLYEARPGEFSRFWLDAVSFWCDVAPLVRAGYDSVLAELGT